MHAFKCSRFWSCCRAERFSRKLRFYRREEHVLHLFPLSVSLQVALHACGVATDMVTEHCIQAGAAFVVSPCCYGFIQNAIKFTFPKRSVHARSLSPLKSVCFLKCRFWPCFPLRLLQASVLLFSLSDFFFQFFSPPFSHSLSRSLSHINTIYISCLCFLFTPCLLSSPLRVW